MSSFTETDQLAINTIRVLAVSNTLGTLFYALGVLQKSQQSSLAIPRASSWGAARFTPPRVIIARTSFSSLNHGLRACDVNIRNIKGSSLRHEAVMLTAFLIRPMPPRMPTPATLVPPCKLRRHLSSSGSCGLLPSVIFTDIFSRGMAPVAHVLFNRFMNFNPKSPKWLNRDRFVLS